LCDEYQAKATSVEPCVEVERTGKSNSIESCVEMNGFWHKVRQKWLVSDIYHINKMFVAVDRMNSQWFYFEI
jgi:hypothetical protein